jgi:hypothetical protein
LKLLKLYLKRYTLSCQLFLNNLATMRDYINFVVSCRQIYDLILNTQIINAQNLLRRTKPVLLLARVISWAGLLTEFELKH